MVWAESEWQKKNEDRVSPIQKGGKPPAPGDYHFNRPEDSFKKSHLPSNHFVFGKEKQVAFTDIYSRRKSYVPGAGHYKFDVKMLSKVSGSPKSISVKRH